MNRIRSGAPAALGLACLALLGVPDASRADLHGRLPATPGGTDYRAVYDDDLGVTWVAHGNLAGENTFGLPVGEFLGPHPDDSAPFSNGEIRSSGSMQFAAALHWIDAMNDAAYLGSSSWRLPRTPRLDDSCSETEEVDDIVFNEGFGCTGSELGHLHNVEGVSTGSPGPFTNVSGNWYWAEEWPVDPETFAWDFNLGTGHQGFRGKNGYQPVLAVMYGDIDPPRVEASCEGGTGSAPEPETPEAVDELLVRCLHEPLWPQDGEPVEIRAEAFDGAGTPVVADRIEIFAGSRETPVETVDGQASLEATVPVAGARSLFYGCRAELGDAAAFSGFRDVEIEALELPDRRAIPVFYSGPPSEKIDIVFLPETDRHPEGARDATFQSDIRCVVEQGILAIPWFLRNQSAFNFWLGRDTADVFPKDPSDGSKKCKKDKPGGLGYFGREYGFAEASGIIHDADCRDNASLRLFTTTLDPDRLQVVSHEIGHAAFTLSDEYTTSQTLYFSAPPFANVLANEPLCVAEAVSRGKDPDACRPISNPAFFAGTFWIFEPDYRATTPETPDLMQQAGEGPCFADDDCALYGVGESEIDRMEWLVDLCEAGRC